MEKLVADLSARIKSLEKKAYLQKKLRVTSHSQPCHTGMCHFFQSSSNSARTKVVFPDKFDGSRRHLRGFLNQLELIFGLQPLTYSSEQLRLQQSVLTIRKSSNWYIPMVEYPAGHSYILSSWEGFKKDMIIRLVSPIRLKNPSPRFVFWVKAPNHALRTLPHSAN
ncbi:hypothetical protein BASA81_015631 [Batrachochytrium salamandrivorans]|nr:hypothetical protein BASA81_015631 [Batrachochytrium salamandrivorans]